MEKLDFNRLKVHELFNVFVPNFEIEDYQELLDIRNDHRISAVRKLVKHLDSSTIDNSLVIQAHEDVLKFKNKYETFSKYSGYVGYLLSIIPMGIGTTLQIIANSVARNWLEREVKWQMFFIERAIQYRQKDIEDILREQS